MYSVMRASAPSTILNARRLLLLSVVGPTLQYVGVKCGMVIRPRQLR